MIKKEDLKSMIKDAIDREERSIPVYMKHLKTAMFWVGIKDDDAKKIKKIFKDLAYESVGHKKFLEELLEKIERSPKDAF